MDDYPYPDEYDELEGGLFQAIGGALGGFLTGGPVGAITGGISGLIGGGGGGSDDDEQEVLPGPVSPCAPPLVWDPEAGFCVFPSSPADVSTGGQVVGSYGAAVNGRYGVAMVPITSSGVRRRCPPGAVLGRDNLCYNKRDLRKDERKWNPGRKPLFTGGDLNAITRAHQLEKKAADIARKLGYSVRSKSAAAAEREKVKDLKRRAGRARRPPQVNIDIDD